MRLGRVGRLTLAIGIAVAGYSLLLIALGVQRECDLRGGPVAEPVAPAVSTPSPAPEATDAVAPDAADASDADASDADDASDAAVEAVVFQFLPGGSGMNGAELTRLLAHAKAVAARPDTRIAIEGYPDRAGDDALMRGIATHRAKAVQTILVKAGVRDSRIRVAPYRGDAGPALLHTVRVEETP